MVSSIDDLQSAERCSEKFAETYMLCNEVYTLRSLIYNRYRRWNIYG